MSWLGESGTFFISELHSNFPLLSTYLPGNSWRSPSYLGAWRKLVWVLFFLMTRDIKICARGCMCVRVCVFMCMFPVVSPVWPEQERKLVADYEVKSISMPVFRIGIVGLKMECKHGSECSSALSLNNGCAFASDWQNFGDNHGY